MGTLMARLLEHYRTETVPVLMEQFGWKNRLSVPRLEKICLNMGVGKAIENPRMLEQAVRDLTMVTGQKAVVTRARKAVSAFRLRYGYQIGARVTLRGMRMYEFLDRLVSVAIPQIRDFRGMRASSFDGTGNYTFGVSEQGIFPEIEPDKVEFILGMDITIVTTAKDDEEGRALLSALGFPFKRT